MPENDNDKLNRRDLDFWGPREPVDHRKLNQPVTELNRQNDPRPPEQVIKSGSDFEVQLFKVLRLGVDTIICNFTNGVTDQPEEIRVALPYLVRITPFNSVQIPAPPLRDGKKYTFLFPGRFDKRTSIDTLNDDDEEIQVITGKYNPGDLIFGMRGINGGTGVFFDDAKTQPIVWQDMNNARFWAKSQEDEE